METKKNEEKKNNNEIYYKKGMKTTINKANSKLLLFKTDDRIKKNLYIQNQKSSLNSKFSNKTNTSLGNKQKYYDKIRYKLSDENVIKNKRKRPFSSLGENNSQYIINRNHATLKNNSSVELNEISKSLNEKKKSNSLIILQKSNNNINTKTNENKINPSTSFQNQNQKIKFAMRLNNPHRTTHYQNLRYMSNNNDKSNFNNNMSSNINSNIYNLFKPESEKEVFPSMPLDRIKSVKNLNIHVVQSLKNKNKKNSFRYYPKSKSLNNSPYYRIRSKDQESIKNNDNELIEYKNVLYSSLPNRYNNNMQTKLRQYNNEIRKRNDVKKNKLNSKEKEKEKQYSFYKYEEYMDKIEKEELDIYKKNQRKKDEINIKELFQDKSKFVFKIPMNTNRINRFNQINRINLIRFSTNKSKSLSKISSNNKEELALSNKSLKFSYILNNNKSGENNSNNNSNRFIRIPIKTKESQKEKKIIFKESNDSSSSEIPIIINNYEVKRTGIRKLRKTNTVIMQNVMLKKFREERILYESEPSSDISRDQLSAEANNLRKKDLLNLSDFLERNRKDSAIENIPFEKISSIPMKSHEIKMKENEIFENLRRNYFQRREKMIKMNRKNLMAQKLLLEKIVEIDKTKNSKLKRYRSKFSPFYNLNYKYSDKEMSKKKKKILDKYYKKNLEMNKFSVRVKNKSSMSFFTNNSVNSSQVHLISQANDLKSEYFSINDYFNNDTQRNQIDKEKDIIKINPNENNYDIKEIEKIDSKINFEENEKEIIKEKEKEKKIKIKLDEIKLNKMIREEKKKKFENEFFKKYEKIIKSREKKEQTQKKIITNEMLEEMSNNFFDLLDENEAIIKSSKKIEDVELFIQFREKMNSLAKFSKHELHLYVYRNFQTINNILEECKRDKQRENRINKFIKILKEDLEEICNQRYYILKFLKVLDYTPFPNNTMNN